VTAVPLAIMPAVRPADWVPGRFGGAAGVAERLVDVQTQGAIVQQDEDGERFLIYQGAQGAYAHGAPGEPGTIVIFRDAEIGEVVHEVAHFEQDRATGFAGYGPQPGSLEWAENELAARQAQLTLLDQGVQFSAEARSLIERQIRDLQRQAHIERGQQDP